MDKIKRIKPDWLGFEITDDVEENYRIFEENCEAVCDYEGDVSDDVEAFDVRLFDNIKATVKAVISRDFMTKKERTVDEIRFEIKDNKRYSLFRDIDGYFERSYGEPQYIYCYSADYRNVWVFDGYFIFHSIDIDIGTDERVSHSVGISFAPMQEENTVDYKTFCFYNDVFKNVSDKFGFKKADDTGIFVLYYSGSGNVFFRKDDFAFNIRFEKRLFRGKIKVIMHSEFFPEERNGGERNYDEDWSRGVENRFECTAETLYPALVQKIEEAKNILQNEDFPSGIPEQPSGIFFRQK